MKIRTLLIVMGLLLFPGSAYCQNPGENIFYGIVLMVIISPYYVFSCIPYFIQRKNKGKSFILSLLTYILCVFGIVLANFQFYKFGIPSLKLNEEGGIFYLSILPFIVVLILAGLKDYKHR